MRGITLAAATVAATVAMASTANAVETISAWGMYGETGDQAFTAPTVEATNVTGANMVRGAGLGVSAASNCMSSVGWDDLAADDYFSFGFSVAGGYSVDLDSLIIGTRSSNTGPGNLGLFYSGDGFTTNLYTFTQVSTAYNNSIIDLSSLTGITGSVEFRIYALNAISANGGSTSSAGTFRVSDYYDGSYTASQFTGTVIPTPGSLALLGLGGLAATRRRRA